jgi:DNA-binding PadR family transcriptional regulator
VRTPFRITSATLDVLEAFLVSRKELHGFAVAKAAGKPTGSIYPILGRPEQADWLDSHWEAESPTEGRPRRRFYFLTPTGAQEARTIVIERRGQLPTPAVAQPPRPKLASGFLTRWAGAW